MSASSVFDSSMQTLLSPTEMSSMSVANHMFVPIVARDSGESQKMII